jgi:hypothetical protein
MVSLRNGIPPYYLTVMIIQFAGIEHALRKACLKQMFSE